MLGAEHVSVAIARTKLAADCNLALRTLGFSKAAAKAAVAKVRIERGEPLEQIVRAALRMV
jgi:Holliday junction resolvasome RuvABC DNA-binding subunit